MSLKQRKTNPRLDINKNVALATIRLITSVINKTTAILTTIRQQCLAKRRIQASERYLVSILVLFILAIFLDNLLGYIIQSAKYVWHEFIGLGFESKDAITITAVLIGQVMSSSTAIIVVYISITQNSYPAKENRAEEIYKVHEEFWQFLSEIASGSNQAMSYESALNLYKNFANRIMASGSSGLQKQWLELKPVFIKICLNKTELSYAENQDIILDCIHTMNKQIRGSTALRIRNDTFNKFIDSCV